MFCFQRPFTRTPRRSSTGPALEGPNSPGSTKMMKIRGLSTKRRSSEVISDGSRSSSIQFIDQEVSLSTSSSTDTLPGICADYLDGDPLSPGSAPLATPDTLITTNGPSVDDPEMQVELAGSPTRGPKLRNARRRRKMLLRITSRLSNSNGSAGESPLSLSPAHFTVRQDSNMKKKAVGGLKARSANDLLSLNASSQEEEDGQSDDETETEEGSSLPSSPAATISVGLAPAQVPYYSFLSANGGAMRQESTSTSSPQLSSGVEPLKRSQITVPSSVADDCPSGMSLLKKPDTLESGCLPAARSCPNLEQQSTVSSASESSSHSPSPGPCGPRFKPLQEGDIQLCYLNHTRTLVSKILSSKFLRRWETHHLYLNDACLSSKTPTGFLHQPILYSSMTEVYTVARWDPTYKYCLRIVLPDGSLLLQASNAYTRDQWYHSILWKKNIFKYQHTISLNPADDVVLRELKSMVDFSLWTPLQDERINRTPLEAMAKLLEDSARPSVHEADKKKQIEAEEILADGRSWVESVFAVAAPLLEKVAAPPILARLLAKFIQKHPTSCLVPALTTAITRCLKYTVDFGKCQGMRELGQMWLAASYDYEDGEQYIRDYIQMIHGPGSDCPHPRIAPNLAAICIAGIFQRFEVVKLGVKGESGKLYIPPLQCFLLVLDILSEYADWRPELAGLIHPIPFPPEALSNKDVQDIVLLRVVRRLANDPRCHVHQRLLPMHEIRTGWIYIVAPPNPTCPDDGTLFAEILTSLLKCCCRRKKFVNSLLKRTESACMLLAVRSCQAAQEALGLMLEWRLLTSDEMRVQVTSALQSTPSGRALYSTLCQQQRSLQELQQKGGPKKLTLPTRATDADVALLLGGGALGNLEYLSLAFTSVTSACAEELIKLPGLRHLNLWATQFGDAGLQMISEHLPKLQVLNLCETPVSDRGISTLGSLTNLRKLNLNSTKLSAQAFESLKKRLPALQEFDVRYTEAW